MDKRCFMKQGLILEDLRACDNWALRFACRNGHLDVVKFLLNRGLWGEDLSALNNYALRWACQMNHLEVVQALVDHLSYTRAELQTLISAPAFIEKLTFSDEVPEVESPA